MCVRPTMAFDYHDLQWTGYLLRSFGLGPINTHLLTMGVECGMSVVIDKTVTDSYL